MRANNRRLCMPLGGSIEPAVAEELTESEVATVRRRLLVAANGPFFPDWEFETLFGLTHEELRRAASGWPSPATLFSTRIALNQLTVYPRKLLVGSGGALPSKVRETLRSRHLAAASRRARVVRLTPVTM